MLERIGLPSWRSAFAFFPWELPRFAEDFEDADGPFPDAAVFVAEAPTGAAFFLGVEAPLVLAGTVCAGVGAFKCVPFLPASVPEVECVPFLSPVVGGWFGEACVWGT